MISTVDECSIVNMLSLLLRLLKWYPPLRTLTQDIHFLPKHTNGFPIRTGPDVYRIYWMEGVCGVLWLENDLLIPRFFKERQNIVTIAPLWNLDHWFS